MSLVEGLPQSERLPRLLASLPDSVLAQLKRGSIRWLAETDWERLPEEEMESLFLMAVWSWRLVQEEPAGATAGLSARDAELAMLAIACCLIAESGRRRGARLSLPANPFHPAAMRALRAEMHREMGDFLSLPAAIALA